MKCHKIFKALFFFVAITSGHAQSIPFNQHVVDSISRELPLAKDDTIKVRGLITLARMHLANIDSAMVMKYAEQANTISKKIDYTLGRIESLGQMAFLYVVIEDWPRATMEINEAMPLCKNQYFRDLIFFYSLMYVNSALKGDMKDAKGWAMKSLTHPLFQSSAEEAKWATYMQLGRAYLGEGKLDSSQYYADIIRSYPTKYLQPDLKDHTYYLLGTLAKMRKHFDEAIRYYHQAQGGLYSTIGLASAFGEQNNIDSAIYYAKIVLDSAQEVRHPGLILESSELLSSLFRGIDPKLALHYLQLYVDTQDDVFNSTKLKALEEIKLNELKGQFDKENQEAAFRNTIIQISLVGIAGVFLIAAVFFLRSNRIKQTANKKLQEAYLHLETTQAQLIQSEKMASLGELTAGIAHEIQNPLNFVNNFSEVNSELMDELEQEANKGNLQEIKAIAKSIKENEQKIVHHGKRADAIVKGMLQHSRSNSGVREPTNINVLADEYLRLAYHGFKAKDKSFSATTTTDFDPTIGEIDIIPQEIGRVILNLITNAFYATSEKKKQDINFDPMVTLTTKRKGENVLITVKDNGNGIPEKLMSKIFQPFFTTKPTGQGTGLGLSISFDIIKAHGGELKVDTSEGKGSEFTIELPLSKG